MSHDELVMHNYLLSKRNAKISMYNYKKTGLHFYLVHAIDYTRQALKGMRYLTKKGEYA